MTTHTGPTGHTHARPHGGGHGAHSDVDPAADPATVNEFWDERYRGLRAANGTAVPTPSPLLVEVASGLAPGAALDLGCAGGGDTCWLAAHGWRVTGVDISAVALELLMDTAREAGLDAMISTERHDLAETFPAGRFDLISAQYLQTPFDFDRATALRRAAEALLPGGHLLVVDHGAMPPWSTIDPDTRFPTPREVADELGLDPAGWVVARTDVLPRTVTGPDGQVVEITDNLLLIQRLDV